MPSGRIFRFIAFNGGENGNKVYTEKEALQHWNLAPLATRRDVAMLSLVHRTVLGKGPKHFRRFFRRKGPNNAAGYWTRRAKRRHDRELEVPAHPQCPELLKRSALGLARVYNWLPAEVVNTECVKKFQGKLQDLVKSRAREGLEDWAATLSPRLPWWNHPLR